MMERRPSLSVVTTTYSFKGLVFMAAPVTR
jgi:hypothetical protein